MTRRRVLIVLVVLLIPAAIHAIWDQVESTLFAREVTRIAQRHEPVSAAFQRSALRSPEQRRAARMYASAANLAAWKYRDEPRLSSREAEIDRAFAGGQPTLPLEALRRQYVEGEPALDLLALASSLEFSGFGPIAPELYENGSPLVELNAVNGVRVDASTARGDARSAADALIQSLRLQRTLSREFYRYQAFRRIHGSLRLLLRYAPPDPETLARLQRAFEELPDEDSIARQIQVERAKVLGDFWPYPLDAGSWALRPRMSVRDGGETIAFAVLRPVITHAMRLQLKPFQEAIDAAGGSWPAKLDARRALTQRYGLEREFGRRAPGSFLDRALGFIPPAMGIWALGSDLPIAGMGLAIRRTAIATLGVERFRRAHGGDAPATLDPLVPAYLNAVPQDPFSGQPLRYRRAADSYIVYSVDVNRTDDGGVLYGFGSGTTAPIPGANDSSPRDIGIRVPLTPHR